MQFKPDLEDYLSTLRNTSIRTLQDVVNFNIQNSRAERFDELNQDVLLAGLQSKNYKMIPNSAQE